MGRLCRVFWPYLWCGGLLCVLSALSGWDAAAATRKFVKTPSAQTVVNNPGGPATRAGDTLSVPGRPIEGEFIPGIGPGKIPVNGILPGVDYSIARTFDHMKGNMKGGVIGFGLSIGLEFLLSQVDAVMDQGVAKIPSVREIDPTPGAYNWSYPLGGAGKPTYASPESACRSIDGQVWASPGSKYIYLGQERVASHQYRCVYKMLNPDGSVAYAQYKGYVTNRNGNSCPQGSSYDTTRDACMMPNGHQPLPDSALDTMFDIANQQNSEFIKDLLKDACNGSPSPAACFDELKEQSVLSGPSTVSGPSTTTTTTTVNASGVATETAVTTKTDYKITYGDNYFDYRKTTNISTSIDGVPQSETTTEEEEQVTEEVKEDPEEPVLCSGASCDGPEYVDLYEPTEQTKEDSIDGYMSRLSSIPLIAAVGGLFDISVSGSCPVWEVHHQMSVGEAVMPIDLRFDYLCLPWVVSLQPWIQAVMIAVCAMLAVRIALL